MDGSTTSTTPKATPIPATTAMSRIPSKSGPLVARSGSATDGNVIIPAFRADHSRNVFQNCFTAATYRVDDHRQARVRRSGCERVLNWCDRIRRLGLVEFDEAVELL